jgi:flagellar hook-associated protein 3 FlgL
MTWSRVTQRGTSDNALRGLQTSLARTQKLQNELSSGKRVANPGDDPAAAASSMALRSQRRADEQYIRNADDASGRLNMADNALTQLSDRIRRVRELLIQSGDGALGTSDRQAISAEINAIKGEVKDLYNTKWLNRPVFGGTTTSEFAVDPDTGAYVGNDAPITTRISRQATIRTDIKGSDVGADSLPALLDQISANITGNPSAMSADLGALDGARDKILQALGDVGARAARVDATKNSVDSERLDFTSRISENEEIDLPLTIMNLESQKVAYQAALGAASKIMQSSLVDFLR